MASKNRNSSANQIETVAEALLKQNDSLGVVVRGHLFVESVLIQLIEESLQNPAAIDMERLSFPVKISLAVALGLVPEAQKRGYLALNKLRNKLAHNANADVNNAEKRDLFAALTKEQRSPLKGMVLDLYFVQKCVAFLYKNLAERVEVLKKKKHVGS